MKTKRLIYHCKHCGYTLTKDIEYTLYHYDCGVRDLVYFLDGVRVATKRLDCPNCQHVITANAIEGRYNPDHECGEECTHATTARCSCTCGGANHGSKYQTAFATGIRSR